MGSSEQIEWYLSGNGIYGDDFSLEETEKWYRDEADGYADLGAKNRKNYRYAYHAVNKLHGFGRLKDKTIQHALGFGSAYGDEFLPIAERIQKITILDPSDHFAISKVGTTPVDFVKAVPSGDLPFEDAAFDLITCFGVLHHIPNVSHVLGELYRCLDAGGLVLLREPITSMGDWRKPRKGLTKRERGFPLALFDSALCNAGFKILTFSPLQFPIVPRLSNVFCGECYNSTIATVLDRWLSRVFLFNYSYHRQSVLSRLAPGAAFWVLSR